MGFVASGGRIRLIPHRSGSLTPVAPAGARLQSIGTAGGGLGASAGEAEWRGGAASCQGLLTPPARHTSPDWVERGRPTRESAGGF
jgi:hypothetical protein